jgi:hypothetical protein
MSILNRPVPARGAGLAALCAVGALAVPAGASAATTVVAGPLKVKDYSMTVSGIDDGARDSLTVMFNRRAGKASQAHMYSFPKGVTITTNKSLSAARIKANLGRYGKIDLKLRGVGAAKRGGAPKGCKGSAGTMRAGTFAGKFKLVADTTYFKTVSAKSLKAQLVKGGKLTCDGGGTGGPGTGTTGETMLMSTQSGPDGMLMFTATKSASGAVTVQAMRTDDEAKAAPASVMHLINAPGTSSAFAPAADLSSAKGTAVSPFFSGAFTFASDMAMGTMATGTLSGDLAARFDSIGTQQLAAGSDAQLMKR